MLKRIIVYEIPEEDTEVRCSSCGALIAKRAVIVEGYIEIKCKCKTINRISFK